MQAQSNKEHVQWNETCRHGDTWRTSKRELRPRLLNKDVPELLLITQVVGSTSSSPGLTVDKVFAEGSAEGGKHVNAQLIE
jgi:hypothetical protein